ncbi:hypothetical protein N8A98_01870 (plasmid) [Devosia neptuniae]|uniref:Eps11J n=1 Tax=Devosia neptuniae TaxID=191302 RepID=A0ABY6C6E9_9HYPH|nr:hypothetical protein [Devosia neptuniae]UXN67831.1 hypothetical protein N8A98_01870 [Devosia neptuniae]
MDLHGKNVLLIAPKFFGYDADIANELRRRGAQVDFIRDRPFDSAIMMAMTRIARTSVMPFVDRLYTRQLEGFGRSRYDLILVVNGQTLSGRLLAQLRTSYPESSLVLYLWDSVANRTSTLRNMGQYDSIYSFDQTDSKTFGLQHRPLFYSPAFSNHAETNQDIDISFIGTAHTDRAFIVNEIDRLLPQTSKRFWYLYLQAPWVFMAYKLTNPSFRRTRFDQFSFTPLNRKTVQSVFSRSKAILDIEHPRQTGLTIRTFETLGSRKKLVTTNRVAIETDFYHQSNIHVIDRKNPKIRREFTEEPYEVLSDYIYNKYSISGWTEEILSGL